MSQDYARVPNYRQGALARRPGYTSGRVSEDGTSVFYESIIPPNARGVVIISPGLKPVASSAMPTLMERLVDRGIGSLWLLYEADTPFYVRERKCRIAVERAALPLHLPLAGFGVSSGASVLLHLAARTDFFRGVGLKSIVGNYLASYRTVQGLSERARSEVFPFSINDYGSSRPDFQMMFWICYWERQPVEKKASKGVQG
ncbi:hypothetical protein J4457_03565 [Candidatus Woesearchaeota archaeon]|nr:hypothetical protein [Candidatus Woesearchaeota archaeon]